MKRPDRGTVRRFLIALVVLLVVIQVVRPARTNPTVDPTKTLRASGRLPADVGAIFDRACQDCHSSETRWPWYSEVAPVSWMLVHHVNDARHEYSFSTWADIAPEKKAKKLRKICEEVREGEMPLWSYLLMHPVARLSDEDKQVICDWTERMSEGTKLPGMRPARTASRERNEPHE